MCTVAHLEISNEICLLSATIKESSYGPRPLVHFVATPARVLNCRILWLTEDVEPFRPRAWILLNQLQANLVRPHVAQQQRQCLRVGLANLAKGRTTAVSEIEQCTLRPP